MSLPLTPAHNHSPVHLSQKPCNQWSTSIARLCSCSISSNGGHANWLQIKRLPPFPGIHLSARKGIPLLLERQME